MTSRVEVVYIGLGGNLGDAAATLRSAIAEFGPRGVRVTAVSPFYRTEPYGLPDQPWFVNAVVRAETDLSPEGLLSVLMEIERAFGRVREERWGPRTLDCDILLYGERVMETPGLVIPHPGIPHRRFVLAPLSDLAPRLLHPVLGATIAALLAGLPASSEAVERLDDP